MPTRAACIQSTNAATIRHALGVLVPEVGPRACHTIAPCAKRQWITLGGDKAGGVVRAFVEIAEKFLPFDRVWVLLLFCMVHKPQESNQELLKALHIFAVFSSFTRLLRSSYYTTEWLAAQTVAAGVLLRNAVKALDEKVVAAREAASYKFVSRVCEMTIFRKFAVKARSHPLEPRPRARPDDMWLECQTYCQELCDLWHVNPIFFTVF